MKAVALHSTSDSAPARKQQKAVAHPVPVSQWFPQTVSANESFIQRKADCACGGDCPACQTKSSDLKVSQRNDPAEIEADHIADKVMRMPADNSVKVNHHNPNPVKIHAKCGACEEAEGSEQETVLRKEGGVAAVTEPPPDDGISSVKSVISSRGRPLDAQTRSFFEPRFGTDLSHVRIHTGDMASQSARSLNSRAYTLGNNIVFGSGEYKPESRSGRYLIAHELVHTVQQTSTPVGMGGQFASTTRGVTHKPPSGKNQNPFDGKPSIAPMSAKSTQAIIARQPTQPVGASDASRREMVDAAGSWLTSLARQVETMRQAAAIALATTEGSAAASRAFHRYLNQGVLERLINNAISVFEAQKSDNPYVNFPAESPEQTRLGEAYARAIEQLGLAIEEALANAANLAPDVRETEERGYGRNHLRWLEANPSAPLSAGIRDTFTQTEVDISTRRYQQTTTELANLTATLHRFNLAGRGAQRLRSAILDASYRLVRDPASGRVSAQPDVGLNASVQPIIDQLEGIDRALSDAITRLDQAETRTRAFAADPAANAAVGNTLQAHFATRDPGYATLLADRFARMARELRGEGSLTVHARDPQDTSCGVGSIGGGLSITAAHAEPNHFYFCRDVTMGDQDDVSTVVHETVHAVIPGLGALTPLTTGSATPRDRSYASERIYSRLSTEEALDNAESYSFYVDALLGIQVQRAAAPQDSITGCTDADAVRDAIARATYRIRLMAMWADQTADSFRGQAMPQFVIDIIGHGFPGADEARARQIMPHLRNLSSSLEYYLPAVCRTDTDREARAGGLVYGPANRALAGGLSATSASYPGGTLRICPAWFQAIVATREDSLTSILVLRYRSSVPVADVAGIVALARFIQEEAHPSLTGRSLQQHQAADAPPPTP